MITVESFIVRLIDPIVKNRGTLTLALFDKHGMRLNKYILNFSYEEQLFFS